MAKINALVFTEILAGDFLAGSIHPHLAVLKPNGAITNSFEQGTRVTGQNENICCVYHFPNTLLRAVLKFLIARRKPFVENQNLRSD